jgi:dimethylargininase
MHRPRAVLVRAISASYPRCIRSSDAPIDLPLSRAQHQAYVEALRSQKLQVEMLPALDGMPDAVFVEDNAVVIGRRALIARSGAPARREESEATARALAAWCEPVVMDAPATLDGGDVLRVGSRLFVGLSGRTNAFGFEQLARLGAEEGVQAIAVPVANGLHLKSACTLADERGLLYVPEMIDPKPFVDAGLEAIPVEESVGGNVLAIGDVVLVSAAAERTSALLRARGRSVLALEVGEIHKGDGALTCMSIRIPERGEWVT